MPKLPVVRRKNRNLRTTTAGGVLGALLYLHDVGLKLPHDFEEFAALGIALVLAWFGLVAKDK